MFLAPAVAAAVVNELGSGALSLPDKERKKKLVGVDLDARKNEDAVVGKGIKPKKIVDAAPMTIVPKSEVYDEYIDLRPRQILRSQEATGAASADTEPSWVYQQVKQGARFVGDALYSAAGDLLTHVSGKVKKSVMNKMKQQQQSPQKKARKPSVPKAKNMPVYGKLQEVTAPVNISRRINIKTKPRMTAGAKGLVITHREMIGQIISSGTTLEFSTNTFAINPGKFGTFPWLSNIACNFDKYIMRRLRFYTISNQSTSVAGRVGLGFDVDSTDVAPADRNEFFSLTYHAECAPWDSVTLDIPVDNKERFINSHTTTDSKLIDIGQIILMSDAVVATSTALSDVVVEYTVELIDPQQAVYSTQYINGTNFTGPTLDLLPSYGPVVSQLAGPGFTNVSTSAILYLKLLQGYYSISIYANDTGAGTPGLALAVSGGTGRSFGSGTTTERSVLGVAKVTTNDGYFRITTSTVAVSDLEELSILVTRISAAVYVKMIAAGIYNAAMTTF